MLFARVRGWIWVLGLTAAVTSCATIKTDSEAPGYLRGKAAFTGQRWREADDELAEFIRTSCGQRASGCQRAVWMKVQADLRMDRPAQAIVDAELSKKLGPAVADLSPSVQSLREEAAVSVRAKAAKLDRSSRLQLSYRNEIAPTTCHLRSLAYSIDLQGTTAIPVERADGKTPFFDSVVFPGEHLLTILPHFACAFRGGQMDMPMATSFVVAASADRAAALRVTTHEIEGPPLATPPELVVNDLDGALAAR